MGKKRQQFALDVNRKNRKKIEKTILQVIILLVVGFVLFDVIFGIKKYEEPDKSEWKQRDGFIAISYFGVGRSATSKLVAKSQLDQQLKALYDQGYQTISQQDILDFYNQGEALPDKALFLSFEDGRNDSSLFAQPILEKYNYKATFLSYANKMGNSERKFLQPDDMLKMTKTGYWELGTNGYRLTYINIFDKDGTYIGNRDEGEWTDKESIEYYNHYLMDFIRDENMIPLENRTEMEERIAEDYQAMEQIYTKELGYIPGVYMIMHANAMNQSMNPLVSDANNVHIHRLFQMHFNREGNAFNPVDADLYDLTRVQSAAYWSTNHLLMKIQKDTGQKMQFVDGNQIDAEKWKVLQGAAEFAENRIILTSPPDESGQLYLSHSDDAKDVRITAKAKGNVVGRQAMYVRYDPAQDSFIRLILENNQIYVEQKKPQQEIESVFSYTLDPVQWTEEDLQFDKASVYTREQTSSGRVSDEEEYPVNIQHTRELELAIQGDVLKLAVDKQILLDNFKVDEAIDSGGVLLEARYHELNEKDDIYDAIFEDVQVIALDDLKDQDVLFNHQVTGITAVIKGIENAFHKVVDWTVDTF